MSSNVSIFDLFSIGVGPSSSHTVGPMRAAYRFASRLLEQDKLVKVESIKIELYGSLALTGKGHATDLAVLNGLRGFLPEQIDPRMMLPNAEEIICTKQLSLYDKKNIHFICDQQLVFHQDKTIDRHANAMRFSAYDKEGNCIHEDLIYSIGGGFIVDDVEFDHMNSDKQETAPFSFNSTDELMSCCKTNKMQIDEIILANEKIWRSEQEIKQGILQIAMIMFDSIDRGCKHEEGLLPGGLKVRRRAPALYKKLIAHGHLSSKQDHDTIMNWLNVYAIAVNEENASGSRIVTAPTNGASGVIPAVLNYYRRFYEEADDEGIIRFLLIAGAIAILYKKGASISAAEVGCQGEIGVACSMAAGALTAVLGGNLLQIENAAEIGMEHHLGLSCDPIKGLVQIPCIERNAMAAVQAVNAAKLALLENEKNKISLDTVIATMLRTGRDMDTRYKETSLGGLAVSHPEC